MEDRMPLPKDESFSVLVRKVVRTLKTWCLSLLILTVCVLAAWADPSAYAGPFQAVQTGAVVQLDGSGSTNSSGYPLSYQWTQTGGPAVTLSDQNSSVPTFASPLVTVETEILFRLTVKDERGAASSDPVTIFIEPNVPGNHPPTSNAGPNQTVNENSLVTLNGSGSDPDTGDTLRYEWCQCKRPDPHVTITDFTNPHATFQAPTVGSDQPVYLNLYVFDSHGIRAVSQTIIFIKNLPPTANAGPDQTVSEGDIVFLDGSASFDPSEAAGVSIRWTQVSGPNAPLDNATIIKPKFKAPFVSGDTDLTFRLTIVDSKGVTTTDDVVIHVKDIGLAPPTDAAISDFKVVPNPTRPSDGGVHFKYSLNSQPTSVTITIHDLLGHLVKKFDIAGGDVGATAGFNTFTWDERNDRGDAVASDGYIVQLVSHDQQGNTFKAKDKAAIIR